MTEPRQLSEILPEALHTNRAGRPSLYTPEVVEEIVERLALGEPLAVVCRDPGMPAYRTVKSWQDTDPAVDAAIARAREQGEEQLLVQCLTIADTPQLGVTEKLERRLMNPPTDEQAALYAEDPERYPLPEPVYEMVVVETKQEDMLGHRKLQIETRLKLLAKFNPKRWGDRTNVDHGVQQSLADLIRESRNPAHDPSTSNDVHQQPSTTDNIPGGAVLEGVAQYLGTSLPSKDPADD